MDEQLQDRVTSTLGARPIAWVPVTRGYTNAHRYLVTLADGRTAFVKAAAGRLTERMLRAEYAVYTRLQAPILPRLLGWDESGEFSVLILEDLRDAFWPPPWTKERVDAVLAALRELAAIAPPAGLPSLAQHRVEIADGGWREVAEEPAPFLALGLCTAAWLSTSLPLLLAASAEADFGGNQLVHMDVRSDNICIRDGRAILIDWNNACVGNPRFDLAGWLPSLHAEGGPPPENLLPLGGAEFAAVISGYFASRAGLPPPSTAPAVRAVQRAQLEVALPWAARALGLPPPDLMER